MAEVRLRLGSGAGRGSVWMKTPHVLLRYISSKRSLSVLCSVTGAGDGYGALHGRCVTAWRSYGTSNSEEIPLRRSRSAYYDILQVSPGATQAQIKTAYYRQSFIYHPDKNAGSEYAASRFSQISEAYGVLRNKTLRKKYDGGFLSEADVRGSSRPAATKDATSGSSGRFERNRRSSEADVGSDKVFDFDTFFRAHYGEQLQRQKDMRVRLEEIKKQEEAFQDRKLGRASEIAVGVMLAVAVAIIFSLKSTKG